MLTCYKYNVFSGDSLILIAQIITAAQMVYEEKYVVTNDISPLQAVGWEGILFSLLPCYIQICYLYIRHINKYNLPYSLVLA